MSHVIVVLQLEMLRCFEDAHFLDFFLGLFFPSQLKVTMVMMISLGDKSSEFAWSSSLFLMPSALVIYTQKNYFSNLLPFSRKTMPTANIILNGEKLKAFPLR